MEERMKWLEILHGEGAIVEIRSISPKPVLSGYFKVGSPNILTELSRYPHRTFYQTLNVVTEACYSRKQCEQIVPYPDETTSDNNIVGYQWILIDADPVRPSGISSTDAEKQEALEVIRRVYAALRKRGFMEPIVADSGNGYHLLYKVSGIISDRPTIEKFLKMLDIWHSTEAVKIDTAVANPARITKLYGTMAMKGADTPERPHRLSGLIHIPESIEITPMDLICEIAGEYDAVAAADVKVSRYSDDWMDAEAFLTTHGIAVEKTVVGNGYTKYILKECPFDPSHKAPDAAVFQYANGCRGFKCFHNSCSGYSWHDFREKVDPNAYSAPAAPMTGYTDFSRLTAGNRPSSTAIDDDIPDEAIDTGDVQAEQKAPIMLNITDIPDEDLSGMATIKSRFAKIDTLIGGFNKGELSVWSGGNASGKSTLVSQIGLTAVTQGYKVAMFSGEMSASRVKYWAYLQAAGRDNVEPDPLRPMQYRLKPGIREKLECALDGHLAVYNNEYGNNWEQVIRAMARWVEQNEADVMIVDNLMALNIPLNRNVDKYEMQSVIATTLKEIARNLNIHVHFICHPRKTDTFLRKNDISGSADLANIADNIFMVHRVTTDFTARVKEVYPRLEIPADVGNAVEIMKNRSVGVVDEMILMYFDKTCKIMSDVKGGVPMFSWAEKLEQMSFAQMGEPFVPPGFTLVPPELDQDNPFL